MKKIIWGILILGILCSGCMNRDFEMDWEAIENITTETEGQTDFEWETEFGYEIEEEKSPYYGALIERMDSEEYSFFYYVDIDHDGEYEVVMEHSDYIAYSYLDYMDGMVVEFELGNISEELRLNQKGYFQKVEYFEDKVAYISIYNAITKDMLSYCYDVCEFNGESISKERCEELLNICASDWADYGWFEESYIDKLEDMKSQITTNNDELFDYEKIKENSENLSLMQKVMLGVEKIHDTADGKMKWIWELPLYYDDSKFHCCDLDGDGKEEVILELNELSVLHEKDGVIYRYSESSRSIIHEDGSIIFTSGASTWCLAIVKEFTDKEIVYAYIYEYVDDVCYKEYNYEGECILMSEEELAAIHEQYKEVMAELYENNYENIINIVW